jgi:hypothetical protein
MQTLLYQERDGNDIIWEEEFFSMLCWEKKKRWLYHINPL